jgi:Ca2+-binding EF-hand superfamily protein
MYASSRYKRLSGRVVRPIFKTEFSTMVSIIRKIMLLSSILFMFAALGTIGISSYYYTKADVVGRIIVIAGVLIALGLYAMAFVGFWAVSNRSKKLVIANAALMFVGLCTLIGLVAVIISFKNGVGQADSQWTTILRNYWADLVATNPNGACSLQGILGCSGFYESCAIAARNVDYCPAQCDQYNQNGVACLDRTRAFVGDHYDIAVVVIGLSIALMGIAILFNFIYFWQLRNMKITIQKRIEDRLTEKATAAGTDRTRIDRAKALYVLKSIDDGELQGLVREFNRIDLDKSGALDKRELGIFFHKALCYKITRAELDVLFETIDVDGDGRISMEEFLTIFKPNISLRDSKQPTELMSLKSLSGADHRGEAMRQRLAKQYGDSGIFDDQPNNLASPRGTGMTADEYRRHLAAGSAPRAAGSPSGRLAIPVKDDDML